MGVLRRHRRGTGRQGHGEPAALAAANESVGLERADNAFCAPRLDIRGLERLFDGRAVDVAVEDIRILGIEDARLHGASEQRLWVVDEVGIHRFIARDEDHEGALAAASGAASLLPKARHRAGEACGDDGIEAAHVDAQLERRRRRHAQQRAIVEGLFQRAAVFGQVARAVGGDALCEVRPAQASGKFLLRAQRDHLRVASRAHEGERARALRDECGHDSGRLRRRGAAHGCAVLTFGALNEPRLPERDGACARRCTVLGDLHEVRGGTPRKARGVARRVLHRRRSEHHDGVRTVVLAQSQQAAEHERDVGAEDPAVGVAFVDDDELEVAQHARPALVRGEQGHVEHVRVRKDEPRVVANASAGLLRGIPVIGRGCHATQLRDALDEVHHGMELV